MLITVAAVGRLKAGPERELFDRYRTRAAAAGKQVGLTFAFRELPESRAASAAKRMTEEAEALLSQIPPAGVLVALDEKGASLNSDALAQTIARWRDRGTNEATFAIGGPDGHGSPLLGHADLRLAFGAMTWPHQIVRILLVEQLYRTVTILSGHPYHRA